MLAIAQVLPTEAELWRGNNPVVHIQHPTNETTLCGLSLTGMELDFADDQEYWSGCKTCWKVYQKQDKETMT